MAPARVIDGKAVAERLRARVAERVAALPFRPGLRVVRVGDDPASAVYVRGKRKACEEVGMRSVEHHLPAQTSEADLLALVVDARVGVHPSDARIVDLLRESGKPFLLVANKVDDPASTDFYDFYRLGAGDPVPVRT